MLYNKGLVIGYTGDDDEGNSEEVFRFKFNTIMSDNDLDKILTELRENLNEMGDKVDFKLILTSKDI